MGNIVLLDDLTINKIAAGEVIERPASVVKEMVENSIDAGSKNISVEIKNGGISFIKITDDGCGISEDDMEIAFERHATSKIRTADDLATVTTMGFRGEALASIASIANVEMVSKKEGEEIGHKIIVEGGKIIEKSEIGCPVGTTITVKNLFFNTPVRYKFLKKDYTEAGYIEDSVKRIALVNKNIAIKFINSGKTVLQTNGSGDFKNIIYSIYGKDIANGIIEVDYTYEDMKITGVVGKPEIARANRQNQLFFVNGRFIKDKNLTVGVDQAYKGMLPAGKFGFVILNLEMNPSKLDVNVHPAKLEVRFQDENAVFKAVYHAIKASFGKDDVGEKIENPIKIQTNHIIEEPKNEIKHELPKLEIKEGMTIEERINAINSLIHEISPEKTMKTAVENVKPKEEPVNKLEDLYKTGKIADKVNNEYDEKGKTIQFGNTQISSNTQEINVTEMNKKLNEMVGGDAHIDPIREHDANIDQIDLITTNDKKENDVIKPIITQETVKIDDNTIKPQAQVEEPEVASQLTQKIEEPKIEEQNIMPNQLSSKKESTDIVTERLLEAKLNEKDSTEIIDTSKVREAIKEIPEITPDFEEMYKKAFGVDLASSRREEEKEETNKKEEIEDLSEKIEEEDFTYITDVSNESLFEESEEYQEISYKFIGVAFSNYIIFEIKNDLYLLDQQMACDRIIYEQIKGNYYKEIEKDSQLLLLPDVVTLNKKQMDIARENIEMFNNAGFGFEEFGDNTIKVSSVPSICESLNTKELFLELLDELDTVAVTETKEKEEKFIATVAFKTAEKTNVKLDEQEAESLLQALLKLPNPFVNATGRPTAIKMTRFDLEKKFSRRK